MNSVTLGLLFTTTQIGIFSTQFKAFETEFTAKTSLKTFLTIYMALSQRLRQVGKDPYLLELSELHQIGVHTYPSPRRMTLFLAPSKTDGPIGRNPREKVLSLSLKTTKPKLTASPPTYCTFFGLFEEDEHCSSFVSLSLTIHLILIMSLLLDF